MTRTRVKGNGMKAASNPKSEPIFYDMKYCPVALEQVTNAQETNDSWSEYSMEIENESPIVGVKADAPKTPKTTWTAKPNIVTPVPSPRQSLDLSMQKPTPMFPFDMFDTSLIPSTIMIDDSFSFSVVSEDNEPQSGDEVFFEGRMFRYLDHLDLDCEKNNPFVDPQAGASGNV
jgi:hypothetical protein